MDTNTTPDTDIDTVTVVTDDRNRRRVMIGGAALLFGIGGIVLGRTVFAPDAPTTTVEPTEEGKEEDHAGEAPEGFVAATPARIKAVGIRTETIAAGTLGGEIIAQATVTAPPEGRAELTARADGAVVRIFKRLGDPVGAGEQVALIESRDAAAFVAERNGAAARAQAARAALARERRLFGAQVTAREDLEAAQAAAATADAELQRTQAAVSAAGVTGNGRYLSVTSLISGRITEVETRLGAYVLAGAQLFEVADPRRIQIEAAVSPTDAVRIRPGDRALIELPSGGTIDAVVRSAAPALNVESRTASVVLTPSGVPAGLAQGQAVRARIIPRGASTAGSIVIPEDAVQSVEGRDVVFVAVKGGFQAKPVTVGGRSGGRAEIVSGIEPGSQVVTKGAFVLKSELGASEAEH